MENAGETVMVLLLLSNLVVLGTSRLKVCIRFFSFECMLLGTLPLMAEGGSPGLRALIMSAGIIGIKGVVFPLLLIRTMRLANVYREVEPFIGFTSSMMAGIVLIGVSFWISGNIPSPAEPFSGLSMEAGIATVLTGILLIVSRKKALTQVIGFLIVENGIFIMGVTFMREASLMVELGVLLDVFAAVFVMSIAAHRISNEFDHIDTDRLKALKG